MTDSVKKVTNVISISKTGNNPARRNRTPDRSRRSLEDDVSISDEARKRLSEGKCTSETNE
jgi:hypothetical protein